MSGVKFPLNLAKLSISEIIDIALRHALYIPLEFVERR